jgi:hypothetical protein
VILPVPVPRIPESEIREGRGQKICLDAPPPVFRFRRKELLVAVMAVSCRVPRVPSILLRFSFGLAQVLPIPPVLAFFGAGLFPRFFGIQSEAHGPEFRSRHVFFFRPVIRPAIGSLEHPLVSISRFPLPILLFPLIPPSLFGFRGLGIFKFLFPPEVSKDELDGHSLVPTNEEGVRAESMSFGLYWVQVSTGGKVRRKK